MKDESNHLKMAMFAIWFLAVAALAMLALSPNHLPMQDGMDKLLHIGGFCLLVLWPAMTFMRLSHILMIAGIFVCSGVALEGVQYCIGRECSVPDMLANTVGIMAGLAISFSLRPDIGLHAPEPALQSL